MARHKDGNWNLNDPVKTWGELHAALLMDIRDELKKLNGLLHCQNFIAIPRKLDEIRRNTAKKKPRARKS